MLTELNLKDNIHWVDRLFVGGQYSTDVWISEKATKALKKFLKKDQATGLVFSKKLQYYAEKGFARFEGLGGPIRHEWHQVYRVAHSVSLFRLIGFYADGKGSFIAIDAFLKSGQGLNVSQRSRIGAVAEVRDQGAWRKRDE